jgi:putative hemolysin
MNVPTIETYPLEPERIPQEVIAAGKYEIRTATTLDQLDEILALRYRVFNLELGEGLASSDATQRDVDEFDAQCHHLMVCQRETGEVVGTYRMQTREMAQLGNGFYSSGEYDLSPFGDQILDDGVEIGRACIDKAHRNGRVLFLLFKGLVRYVIHNQKNYMFGCCSITSQDPEEGLSTYKLLEETGHVHPTISVLPQEGYECELSPMTIMTCPKVEIPRLMQIYFMYSAKICSPPAIDRLFKTIDYMTLVDIRQMDKKSYKGFSE